MNFISGNLWSIIVPTNSSWNLGVVNYTVYANDTSGNVVNSSSNVTIIAPVYPVPNDSYWVNGTGNWSDATNHWALIFERSTEMVHSCLEI